MFSKDLPPSFCIAQIRPRETTCDTLFQRLTRLYFSHHVIENCVFVICGKIKIVESFENRLERVCETAVCNEKQPLLRRLSTWIVWIKLQRVICLVQFLAIHTHTERKRERERLCRCTLERLYKTIKGHPYELHIVFVTNNSIIYVNWISCTLISNTVALIRAAI